VSAQLKIFNQQNLLLSST